MFERWAADFDEVEIPSDAAGLEAAISLWGRLTAKLASAVGEFDRDGGWAAEGAANTVAWVRARGVDKAEASLLVKTARRLDAAPELAEAAASGELTIGQVRAVVANVKARHLERFRRTAAEVIPALVGKSVDETARAMNDWAEEADAEDEGPEPPDREQSLYLSSTLDGRHVITGSLDALGGATVDAALRLADSANLDEAASQRRADALVTVARFFLDNQQTRAGGRHRPHVNVTVDFDAWHNGQPDGYLTESGIRLRPDAVSLLLCDCAVHRVVAKGRSAIIDFGTSTRSVPCTLWNALVLRDRTCRFVDCDRPPTWCDGHHVIEVERNGPTRLDNLVLLCGYHHRLIHKRRWNVALRPGAVLEVTTDTGAILRTRPPPEPEPALAT